MTLQCKTSHALPKPTYILVCHRFTLPPVQNIWCRGFFYLSSKWWRDTLSILKNRDSIEASKCIDLLKEVLHNTMVCFILSSPFDLHWNMKCTSSISCNTLWLMASWKIYRTQWCALAYEKRLWFILGLSRLLGPALWLNYLNNVAST